MVLSWAIPVALPGPLQAWRRSIFYWSTVLNYRLQLETGATGKNRLEFQFLRVVLACLVVKVIEKGNREEKERHLADYNLRKANIDAAERAMWEEELALHTVDTGVAEAAVLRQREVDWKYRSDLAGHARAMMTQLYPFVASIKAEPQLK